MGTRLTEAEITQVVFAALDEFRKELGLDVTAQRIQTMLAIAMNPNMEQRELGNQLGGMADATVSRNVSDLSAITRNKERGPNLVKQEPDPMFRRRNLVDLTPSGRALLRNVTDRVNKSLSSKE